MTVLLVFSGSGAVDADIIATPAAGTAAASAPVLVVAVAPQAASASAASEAPMVGPAAAAATAEPAAPQVAIRVDIPAAGASAASAAPAPTIAVSPPAGAATFDSDPPAPSTSEFLFPPAAGASAGATAPGITIAVSPDAAASIASSIDQLSAWDLYSYLVAARETLNRYQVVLEAELATAEAAWNAADDDGKPAAQDQLDVAAGRLTYCTSSLVEINRALELCAITDLVTA